MELNIRGGGSGFSSYLGGIITRDVMRKVYLDKVADVFTRDLPMNVSLDWSDGDPKKQVSMMLALNNAKVRLGSVFTFDGCLDIPGVITGCADDGRFKVRIIQENALGMGSAVWTSCLKIG